MDKDQIDAEIATYSGLQSRYGSFGEALRNLLKTLCDQEGIEVLDIETRPKDTESLRRKLADPKYNSLDDLDDLCGVRVINFYLSDIEDIVKLVEDQFEVVETVRHGHESAETFGYQSLHMIIRVNDSRRDLPEWTAYAGLRAELQVRTVLQHAWAAISHKLDYNSPAGVPSPSRRKLFRVSALLESGDELFDEFRHEVQELREGYSAESKTDAWRTIPINEDSLPEIWDRLPWDNLAQAAEDSGWQPSPLTSAEDAKRRTHRAKRIVPLLDHVGIDTADELDRYLRRAIAEAGDVLAEVSTLSRDNGFAPYAVSNDVLACLLAIETPRIVPMLTFRDELIEAIEEIIASSPEDSRLLPRTSVKKTPAKKTAAKKTPAKKTPAKKTPAKKTAAKKT